MDLTLRNQKRFDGWDFAFKVLNLFNADAREPSPGPALGFPPLIPNDLPLARRELRVVLNYQL